MVLYSAKYCIDFDFSEAALILRGGPPSNQER
jgi:hypothetical protein